MSIEKLPTVTIMTKNGPVEINMTDYDKEKHTIATPEEIAAVAPVVVAEPVAPAAAPSAEIPASDAPVVTTQVVVADPATYSVGKNGKRGAASKFVIKDAEGNTVGETEYEDEEAANAAIAHLVVQYENTKAA